MSAALKSIGTVTIGFGLVSIPVKLFSATCEAQAAIKFNLLGPDGGRLKQQYINAKGQVIERAAMMKGYEYAKDQFVIFSPAELKTMEEVGTHQAEILEFVPSASVDPLYFDKPYFLAPEVGGSKGYALLARALIKSDRYAIGRWASRGKQHVVLIRPVRSEGSPDGLLMQQLLYSTEVRSLKELALAPTEVKDAEFKLAMQLVDAQATEGFNPSAYIDEVAGRIKAAIEQKVATGSFTMPEAIAPRAPVIDLLAALQASIEKKAATKAPGKKATKKAA
jgi:DNA end-binding protein Ku